MMIRRAKKKDIEDLSILFDKYRLFYKQRSDVEKARSFLKKRMKRKESVIFVAEERDELIGFTQLFPIFSSVSMKRTWLLNDLYVNEKSRGIGAATKLLDAAKEFGAETNSKWLLLQTAAENFTAQKVYEKNGWVKETDLFYRRDI
ncbi:MAG TPA: GNAT family N-acetyltransferase [Chitinophagaceae bacterium]|nr:GNAT family N-acetyltransferase [Chitinophagaceae bacterium]